MEPPKKLKRTNDFEDKSNRRNINVSLTLRRPLTGEVLLDIESIGTDTLIGSLKIQLQRQRAMPSLLQCMFAENPTVENVELLELTDANRTLSSYGLLHDRVVVNVVMKEASVRHR